MAEYSDLTEEYRADFFVGKSPREPGGRWNLQEALEDAYEQGGPGRYRMLWIEVKGENPIDECRIGVQRTGRP